VKKTIEDRLTYLYKGELFSIIGFIPISGLIQYTFPELHLFALSSFWVSLILLELLLLQGSYYWYSKRERLKRENSSITPVHVVRRLHRFQKINGGIIVLAVMAFAVDVWRWHPVYPVNGLKVSGFLFVFAVLEYINYFYLQLSYDNRSDVQYLVRNKKLKRSSMWKDFQRIKKINLYSKEKGETE